MGRTIYFKNFMATATMVLISFLVLGGVFSFWNYRAILRNTRDAMRSASRETGLYLRQTTLPLDGGFSRLDMRMALSMMSRASGFDLLLTTRSGEIILCSDVFDCEHTGGAVSADIIARLSGAETWDGAGTLGGLYAQPRYIVAEAVTVAGIADGYLFTSVETTVTMDVWKHFSGTFIIVASSVMLLTFTVSLITTRRQADVLSEMARAARRFARGEFSVRVGIGRQTRDDEIGELARAFNAMADSLERSDTRRRELLANVSHELRTPMTVIAGFADGILDGTISRDDETRYLATISSETRRMSRLVRSMLNAARTEELETAPFTPFDAGEVIIQTLLGLSPKLEAKGLDAAPELPEEPVYALGDKDSITQVVYNLIDNAVKFSVHGGVIKLALWKQGDRAFVAVENQGEPIPDAELPLIFDRFHKADKSRGQNRDGVGLGLYIVKTILDHHEQDIFVYNKQDSTRFEFTLKLAPGVQRIRAKEVGPKDGDAT